MNCLLQFYPYGDANGDTSLPYTFWGEGSSLPIKLSQDFVFYDQVVRIAYVCLPHTVHRSFCIAKFLGSCQSFSTMVDSHYTFPL